MWLSCHSIKASKCEYKELSFFLECPFFLLSYHTFIKVFIEKDLLSFLILLPSTLSTHEPWQRLCLHRFFPFWKNKTTLCDIIHYQSAITFMQRTSKSTPVIRLLSEMSSPYSRVPPKHLHLSFLPANQNHNLQVKMRINQILPFKSSLILALQVTYF